MEKNISKEELRKFNDNYNWYNENGEGYRIVYLYENDNYKLGPIAKKIENFMLDFSDIYPINDENDILKFISIDNLLDCYLNDLQEINEVAIYKTDGELIKSKKRVSLDIKLQEYLIQLMIKIFNDKLTKEDINGIDTNNYELIYYLSKINTDFFDNEGEIGDIIKQLRNKDDVKLIIDLELVRKYLPKCYQLIEYVNLPYEDKKIKELVYLNEKILYLLPDEIKDMFFMYEVLKNDYKVAMVLDQFEEKNKRYYFLNKDLYNMYIDGLIRLINEDINNYDLISEEAKSNERIKEAINPL